MGFSILYMMPDTPGADLFEHFIRASVTSLSKMSLVSILLGRLGAGAFPPYLKYSLLNTMHFSVNDHTTTPSAVLRFGTVENFCCFPYTHLQNLKISYGD